MTELELLRELGDETPLPELNELDDARARLTRAISSDSGRAAEPLVRRAGRAQRPRRRLFAVATTAGLAAAAAAVLIVLPGVNARSGGSSLQSVASAPTRRLPVLVHPTAAQVLDRAAFVALQTTTVTPSPDQFVYTETGGGGGQASQSWMSVDGLRDSRIGTNSIPGCVNGRPEVPVVPPQPCTPSPAYFPDMPTQASGMLAYLEQTQAVRGDTTPDDLNDLAKQVSYMLDTDYLLPAQQAALYEFLAQTPGITVQTGVTDAAGRPGIGVGWSFDGGKNIVVFDPQTYTYLGTTTIGIGGQVRGEALLTTAIVDSVGQLPAQAATPSPNNDA